MTTAGPGLLWPYCLLPIPLHLLVLLTLFLDDGRLVLFDFGLAKLWQTSCDEPADAPRQLTGQTGSARYMAPEVARSRPYGTSAEVYSFGILLWQLASHERPFAGMDMQRHARQVGLAAAWCVVLVANTPPPLLRPTYTTTTTYYYDNYYYYYYYYYWQVVDGGQRPPLKKGWPPLLCALLEDCWHVQPVRRPGMREVCGRLRKLLDR